MPHTGVDTLLEAVLQVTDVKSALAETGISVGQLEEAVREMRGGAATVDSQSGDQAFDVRHSRLTPKPQPCRELTDTPDAQLTWHKF